MEKAQWDVAIVGAGIAGMSAAQIVAESGLTCVAFDRLFPGGQIVNLPRISNLPGVSPGTSGAELSSAVLENLMDLGVEIAYEEVLSVTPGPPHSLRTAAQEVSANAVIIATGFTAGSLGIDSASDYHGRGLSECASCDGPMYAGKQTAVVGSDEWAAQEAIELAGVAAKVTLIAPIAPIWSARRASLLSELANLEILEGVSVVGLAGDPTLASVKMSDGSELAAEGIFPYCGKIPNSRVLMHARGTDGRLVTDGAMATTDPGIFAAGDIREGSPSYVAAAIGDGITAGRHAVAYVLGQK